jgi:hypothetical protein
MTYTRYGEASCEPFLREAKLLMEKDEDCNLQRARDSAASGGEQLVRKWTRSVGVSGFSRVVRHAGGGVPCGAQNSHNKRLTGSCSRAERL